MVDATQVQIRRGTQGECEGMVPVEGEVICDLTNDTLRVGDGIKAGGHLMPNVARMQSGQYMFATAGGSGNAITVNLSPAVEFLTVGMEFRFLAVANNTGAVTLTLNGLAAMQVRKIQSGSPIQLDADDISSGVIYSVVYDGTYFVILSGVGSGIIAPVAGTGNDIYTILGGGVWAETQSISYAPVDYQHYVNRSWSARVHVAGSVTVSFTHGRTGSGSVSSRVLVNNTVVAQWNNVQSPAVNRSVNLSVNAGGVITVQNRASGSPTGTVRIRDIIISSSTPAYGAISG